MTPPDHPSAPLRAFARLKRMERRHVAAVLRTETVGGALLIVFAILGLLWANSPWRHSYDTVKDTVVGPHLWHLDLSLASWSADFLLAFFFLVAGIELKHELQAGELSNARAAVLPVVSALCGMVVPIAVYLVVSAGHADAGDGWAVPTATDIAFALAVLAVVGQNLPSALRAFLLTLAVVDDLGAIIIIAIAYTAKIDVVALAIAAVLIAAFYVVQRMRIASLWLNVPLGLAIWIAVHASGIHATVAGVAIGLMLRGRVHDDAYTDGAQDDAPQAEEPQSPAEKVQWLLQPFSAGFCVPVFAIMSAGVYIGGDTLGKLVSDRIPLAIAAGLFIGKSVGVFGGAYLTARFTRAELSDELRWRDIAAVSALTGVGFTVSLLISELAFTDNLALLNLAKAGVLFGSLVSALVAVVLLRRRDRFYDQLCTAEESEDAELMLGRE
ncbi:Na+/H+ antiporter NhaA [Catenulispora pinisilvae]|uniref:Na+/H+ antiporter NhaA n=1 Tax=Catenulispora pinisilvae TaxID=2705253 RepID=UPI00189273A6|nr:Na+/H+ antiporter NhaA [Catenulispora pinisilvae]